MGYFRDKYKRKIFDKIIEYAKINYEEVSYPNKIKMGKGMFNCRCQHNAIQQIYDGKMDKAYLCICVDDNSNEPFIHFINKKGEDYIDNTLGYSYKDCTYYIIREVKHKDFRNMDKLLMDSKELYVNMFSNYMLRKLFKITKNII